MIPIKYFAGGHALKPSFVWEKGAVKNLLLSQRASNAHLIRLNEQHHLYRTADSKNSIVPKIGLEVHAQLNLNSKLFSEGSGKNTAVSNSQLDLFDISLPGTLPKLNKNALRSAILTSLALNCSIQELIHFDRKNYFYADMPAGYQITQYNNPIAKDGYIDFIASTYHRSVIAHSQQYDLVKYLYSDNRLDNEEFEPYIKRSKIKQVQLEQDSAKSLHNEDSDGSNQAKYSLIDYNRSGAALIEIVFEPDLENHHEASSLVRELVYILKALDTCDCEFQDGSLRVDANVSIRQLDGEDIDQTGRVELKNLNSLRSLNRGIAHEIYRQASLLRKGEKVAQESRVYDTKLGQSVILREKENAVDYRYVPEPNIPPLQIEKAFLDEVRDQLPPLLPKDCRDNLVEDFGLDLLLVADMMNEPGLYKYFLQIMNNNSSEYDPDTIADFLIYSLANLKDIVGAPIQVDLREGSEFLQRLKPEKMQHIFDMMLQDEISFMTAFEVMKLIFITNDQSEPRKIVNDHGWYQISDETSVCVLCSDIIRQMKNTSKQYRKKGDKKYLRRMLDKLCTDTDNKISVKKALEVFDSLLRDPNASDMTSSDQQSRP